MSIFDCTKCGKRYVTSVGFEKHKCITDIDIKVIIAERDRYKAERDNFEIEVNRLNAICESFGQLVVRYDSDLKYHERLSNSALYLISLTPIENNFFSFEQELAFKALKKLLEQREK